MGKRDDSNARKEKETSRMGALNYADEQLTRRAMRQKGRVRQDSNVRVTPVYPTSLQPSINLPMPGDDKRALPGVPRPTTSASAPATRRPTPTRSPLTTSRFGPHTSTLPTELSIMGIKEPHVKSLFFLKSYQVKSAGNI
ncbi:hypothetical protein CDAR_317831 [Caerostris darwini]|uniref:Transformer n=1 Tax=Caerostris darwini TaxID=1538125 RepID=A0AAV4WTS2_9ARAC|nr:hypothetical protein CDAR_317831 [Caerostris darwini]